MTLSARLLLSTLLILTGPSCAIALTAAPGDTLILTVVNRSDHTLTYKNITGTKPGNFFSLTSNDILPGASVTIRATSAHWAGIAGNITFVDDKGQKNILKIHDPVQIGANRHPASFVMQSPRLVSFVPNFRMNRDTHPLSLAWTRATVEIQNRAGLI